MRPAIVSGIAATDTPVSYWPISARPWSQSQKSLRAAPF